MNNTEFKTKLTEAFKTHMFMNKRDNHTVNELLYILRHDNAFKDMEFNISISKLSGEWWAIPSMDAFVSIPILSVWFNDADVEFEIEEFPYEDKVLKAYCITVYESEEN